MIYSPLVDYIQSSPNFNPRNGIPVTKITIHHVAGIATAEGLGDQFADPARMGSSNYGIGYDGSIGVYVGEENRAWTSGSFANDVQAVTIEVSNDMYGGNWHVSDHVLARLIDLCVDICKRNNIERLNFTGDETGNLTMHKWFQPTACPGEYLESKFPYIADEVNKRLNEGKPMTDAERKEINELKEKVTILERAIATYERGKVYENAAIRWAYIDGNMSEWMKPTIQKLTNKGYLKGSDQNSLEISQDFARTLVILDRAGLFD